MLKIRRKSDERKMASKLQYIYIYELSENVSRNLSGYENRTAFLKSAAWQYKYPFHDQLLIYAQRPDATAFASIDVWNKRLHSWINRGSKGIALLRESDRGQYLDYVFDISDTHSNNGPVRLWQYNSRFDGAIIETIENSFGELKSKDTITEAVISAAQNATCDSKADYLQELKYEKQNSFLKGLDELNIEVELQRTATEQIQSIVTKMAQTEGVTEELKAKNPMMWTGLMNNFLRSAEEIVLPEVVYS